MTDHQTTKSLDWHLPEIADKAEHEKMIRSFRENEKVQNMNRLLYPPDVIGPASQLTYNNERRN